MNQPIDEKQQNRDVDVHDVAKLADEAALAFIQGHDVRIETDSPQYRALVRSFVNAYEAGQRSVLAGSYSDCNSI